MPSLDDEENPELRDFSRRFWWTLPLTLIVLVLAMFGHYWPALSVTARTWIELVLSVPVVLWAGSPFFERCVASIRNRSPTLFTLIGIAVAAALGSRRVSPIPQAPFPPSSRSHGRGGGIFAS